MLHVEQTNADPLTLTSHLAETFGLRIPDGGLKRLQRYSELLVEWNNRHNLVSRADIANIWPRHILHSIIPVLLLRIPPGLRFVDVGSGGGLPGIPIAILRPDLNGVLVDSIRKKTEALSAMVNDIGIENLTIVNERVECAEFLRRFKGSFDIVFARGVSRLPQLVEWSLRLFRPRKDGGERGDPGAINPPVLISYKGGDVRDEIRETTRIFPGMSIREVPIDVGGVTGGDFSEKKLIIITPKR